MFRKIRPYDKTRPKFMGRFLEKDILLGKYISKELFKLFFNFHFHFYFYFIQCEASGKYCNRCLIARLLFEGAFTRESILLSRVKLASVNAP